jgi:hypothetical protein
MKENQIIVGYKEGKKVKIKGSKLKWNVLEPITLTVVK